MGVTKRNAPLPPAADPSGRKPKAYKPALCPAPSILRPHVLARERLRCWRPLDGDSAGNRGIISEAAFERIRQLMILAWAEGTHEVYGTGLLTFHVFCDEGGIPEKQRAPASSILMESFVATLAGSYSAKAIGNYVAGVRAWHILHGQKWEVDEEKMKALLKAAGKVSPATSRRVKRKPFTPSIIIAIRQHLDLSKPLHAAVYACLTTAFYCAARLGEFTVVRPKDFNPRRHVKRSDVRDDVDRNGLKTKVFRIPRTKASPTGEDVCWAAQSGDSDPAAALEHHFLVNEPPLEGHLFAYKFGKSHRPLSKKAFLDTINPAIAAAGIDPLQGHGIRIGATLEYLLRGVPFNVMKAIGRWAGDSFYTYLSQHAQILAPYLQEKVVLHEAVLRASFHRPRA